MRLPLVRACSTFIAAAAGIALLVGAPEPAFAKPTQHDISHEEVQLHSEPDGCPGHVITGSTSNPKNKILIESGEHDITINNVYIELDEYNLLMNGDSPFAIGGNATVHLTIEGTNSFASHVNYGDLNSTLAAIWVQPGSTLIIDGPGRLVAKADDPGTTGQTGAAGIGGGYNQDFGDIIINEGRIEAYGSAGGAGIGDGYSTASGSHSGNITINGGYVQAFGGSRGPSSGAGIGAGVNSSYTGTITINGGGVRAVGGDADQTSIGGGGHATSGLNNGTFTTGENGNAVIFAPWGIGDMSGVADWDCILLESTRDEGTEDQLVNYSQDPNGRVNVTFKGGTLQVYGDVKADYNIQVDAPASLRIVSCKEQTMKIINREAVFKDLNGSTGNDGQGTGDSGQNGEQGNEGTPGGGSASSSNNGSDHGTQAGLLGTGDSLPIVIALVAAAGVAIVVIGARLRSKR